MSCTLDPTLTRSFGRTGLRNLIVLIWQQDEVRPVILAIAGAPYRAKQRREQLDYTGNDLQMQGDLVQYLTEQFLHL